MIKSLARPNSMRSSSLVFGITVSCLLVFCFSAHAQVSFLVPPYFAGTGTLFVADFNGDGKPDILMGDGTLNLGQGDGTFVLGTSISDSSVPVLAVADFSGDGKADVLEQGAGTLLVLLGNGDGTFQPAISTRNPANLAAVAAIDINGDGKPDVLGVSGGTLYVFLGKGDGTFTNPATYDLGAVSAENTLLTLGDFNGDKNTDIAVSIAGDNVAGAEIVLLGNGDGTFQTATKTSAGIYYPAYAAVAGDFNGDGKLDLAVPSDCAGRCSDAAYVLLGNGDGTFQAPTAAFPGSGSLAVADLNGDTKLDLVQCTAAVQIYLGNGDGTFTNANNYLPNLMNPPDFAMVIADFNLDGKLDIAAGNGILLGNGKDAFEGIQIGPVPSVLVAAAMGDFDKNGSVDIATISADSLYILSNNGIGQLTLTHTYSLQEPGYGIVSADFNGDGNLDLAVLGVDSTDESWSYTVFLGNGDGSFQSPITYSQSSPSGTAFGLSPIVVADFNNDHHPDLAVAVPQNQELAILLGNGDGTFSAPVYYYDAGNTTLLVADYNGDGRLDIAVGSGSASPSAQTAILFGNGDGTFQQAIFPDNLNGFVANFTADLNNDGKPDLISTAQVALGNGDGTFTLLPVMPVQTYGIVSALTDLNGDGKLDALVPLFGVLLGNGDGTFGSLINTPMPNPVLTPDMNGDGLPDVVFLWQDLAVNSVGVLLNTTKAPPPQPDFQVSSAGLSPTPITPGNSAASTIVVTPLNGFTGSVALSCSGLPSSASCSFNPASIANGSGTSSLTVSTMSSLQAGIYTIMVSGISGSISRIAALTLTVESGTTPDFQISASAAAPVTIAPGSATSSTVSIASVDGFSSTVVLNCSSGTSGVTCSLNPVTVTPSGSSNATSTLTIDTTAATVPGTYSITAYGTSGSDVHSTGVAITVEAPQPDFTINTASGSPTSQTISAGQAASFTLALAGTASFMGTVNLGCAITPTVTPAPTCTLSSSSVQISGSGTQSVTVKVGTTASVTSSAAPTFGLPPGAMPVVWTCMLFGMFLVWVVRNRKRLLSVPVMVLALLTCVSCGGSSSSSHTTQGTPSGTYKVAITATSVSLSHNLALQVIVQ
jgi:hypothetical protein